MGLKKYSMEQAQPSKFSFFYVVVTRPSQGSLITKISQIQ